MSPLHFRDVLLDFLQVPLYHLILETFLICWILWLLIRRYGSGKSDHQEIIKLTKAEEDDLIAAWKPEPLVPPPAADDDIIEDYTTFPVVIQGKAGVKVNVDGFDCWNFATHNYLGLVGREDIEDEAVKCIRRYGVGSCGPRAFYGTALSHIHLEEKLAEFYGCQQAVLYSYGFSTIASAIPAYAKRGDIIFADEAVNFAIQKGLDASRSRVKYFKHNDVQHLEELLELVEQEEAKNPKLAKTTRKFLIVEGIYFNTGQIVALAPIINLKERFKFRLFMDESVSLGVLGKTGKGVCELFQIDVSEIDLIMATLENALGSIGGFCVGTSYVVEHQTLAGLGYCFSASLPPMLASGAFKALELIENNPGWIKRLGEKCQFAHQAFGSLPGLVLQGDPLSPIKHLRLIDHQMQPRTTQRQVLSKLVQSARKQGMALVTAAYLESQENQCPSPSLRLTICLLMEDLVIEECASILHRLCNDIFCSGKG